MDSMHFTPLARGGRTHDLFHRHSHALPSSPRRGSPARTYWFIQRVPSQTGYRPQQLQCHHDLGHPTPPCILLPSLALFHRLRCAILAHRNRLRNYEFGFEALSNSLSRTSTQQ